MSQRSERARRPSCGVGELDTFAIDEAKDPAFAQGFGDLTAHEVATDPERDVAYLSYYNGGLRVLADSTGQLTQIGRFIDQGGNNFWGVEWHRTPAGQRYVLDSDRDYGLYVSSSRRRSGQREELAPGPCLGAPRVDKRIGVTRLPAPVARA